MESQDLAFRAYWKNGILELPLWGVGFYDGMWKVSDIRSGQVIESFGDPERENLSTCIFYVLDEDHLVLNTREIFKLSERKAVQDIHEIFGTVPAVTLPAPERYSYATIRRETESVFDPRSKVEKVISIEESKVTVSDWITSAASTTEGGNKKLVLEDSFDFTDDTVRYVLSLPVATTGVPNRILIAFDTKFTIWDLSTWERYKQVRGLQGRWKVFILPSGGLGLFLKGTAFHWPNKDTIVDLTAFLKDMKRVAMDIKNQEEFYEYKLVDFPWNSETQLVLKDQNNPGHFNVIATYEPENIDTDTDTVIVRSVDGSVHKFMNENAELQFPSSIVSWKLPGDVLHFCLANGDVAFLSTKGTEKQWGKPVLHEEKGRKLVICSIAEKKSLFSSERIAYFKEKQTLNVEDATPTVSQLAENLWVMWSSPRQLILWDSNTDKYSLGAKVKFQVVLPVSKRQVKVLERAVDTLLAGKVPKEISGIIAGFF